MDKHEPAKDEFYIDFRTGALTAISGKSAGSSVRTACSALNRKRARGILEVREEAQRRESISSHVWRDAFTGRLEDWEVPLISLESLGIRLDKDGFFESKDLTALKPGAEAAPFWDRENEVVYKGTSGNLRAFNIP